MPTLAKSYQQIKDNPELLAILAEKVKGKGPNGSDLPLESAILTVPMDDNGAQAGDFDAEPAPGTLRTLGETAVGSLSTAIPTGLGSLAVGAATTALTKKPIVGMAAGMAAGIPIAKYATGPLGRILNKKILPESVNRDVEIQQQVNPIASTVGGALANLAIQRPTFGKTAVDIIKKPSLLTKPVELGKVMARDTTALESLKPLNLAASVGGMAGTDVAMQAMEGQPIDWKRVGISAAVAPVLGGGEFRGAIPKIVANRIYRPIAERQLRTAAAEFRPVLLAKPDNTPLSQEEARLLVANKIEANDPKVPEYIAELEQYEGGKVNVPNLLKWKSAVSERRAADADANKPIDQQVDELTRIAKEEQHPEEYLKWLKKLQFKNAKGELVTMNAKQAMKKAEKDALAGGELRKEWEAEVAAAQAAKEAEAAAKGKKKPNAVQKPSTSGVVPQPPEGTRIEGGQGVGPSQQGAETPVQGQPAPKAAVSGEAKNRPVSTKNLEGRPQLTEFDEVDLPIIQGWAKETLGNLPEAQANQLLQEHSGALVDALSKYPPEIARNKDVVQKAFQSILRINRSREAGRVAMTPEGAQAAQIAESQGRGKAPISNELAKVDTENEPTPEPPPLAPADEKATAELSEKPVPKTVPNKTGPGYDPTKPLPGQEHFEEDVLKPMGLTDEQYRGKFAGDNWLPNHPSTPIEIVPSDIQGHGNVTTSDIPAGATIGRAFDVDPKNPTVGLQTQLGRFTNHSRTPNAEIVYENGGMVLKAKEALPAGTELTVDYRDAVPKVAQYQQDLAAGKAGPIQIVKPGTPVKVKKARGSEKVKAAPVPPTTASTPEISPAAAQGSETSKGVAAAATTEPKPIAALTGEPNLPAAQYKAIGDFVASVKTLDDLPTDVAPDVLKAAQLKSKAAADILRTSHGFDEAELNDLASITYDKLGEHNGDVNKATEAAFKELVGSRVPTPGTPYKPKIKGDVGSVLGAVPEMARATANVSKQVYTKSKDYLAKINKGFQEGRTAPDRPEFIRSSVIDTLRPGVLKMGLDKDGKYNGDELLGRLANTMHPVGKQILLDNGLEGFLKGERRSPEEVAKFIEENGPQIEVKKLFAHNAKVDEARQNIANLRHQIENLGYQIEGNRNEGVMYYRNGEEVPFKSMPKEHQKLVTEFEDAVPPNWERDPESATARYTMVNPKELSKMPGAVDLLVRIPQKPVPELRANRNNPNRKDFDLPKYSSPHYPQEGKNLLAHVRGYMETLPDGRKVFHVFEVQSDWAQKNREYKQTAEIVPVEGGWAFKKPDGRITNDIINWRAEPFSTREEAQAQLDRYVEANAPSDPLLKDYNRLALKAAIEHAYREGADAIAISDAETAMMTEGHDAAAIQQGQYDENNQMNYEGPKISQEPGMRFNYDPNPATAGRSGKPGTLHELASELTKYPGERVSFGEHKNAFEQHREVSPEAAIYNENVGRQRENLIFKNPDGSPKTDISAVLYPIDRVAAKLDVSPFSVVGKGPKGMELYSFPGPIHRVIGDSIKTIVKLGGKAAYHGTERFLEGAGERIGRIHGPTGQYFREHVRSFFRYERQLQNEFLEPVFKATDIGLSKSQREKVGKYAYDMDEYGASPIALTPDELRVYNLVRASFDSSRIAQAADGPYQNGKPVSGPTKNFMPQTILSKKVREILLSTAKADEAQRKHYQDLYEQWYRQQSPKPDSLTEAQYVERIHESLGELLGKDPFMGKRNPTFSPLYEHEGIGLPPSMRETDIIDVAGHYGRRWAAGLAWYRSVQKDPIMARIMGVTNDGRGNDYVPPTRDLLPSDSNPGQYEITDYSPTPEYAKNLSNDPDLETYRAQMMRGATQHYDWVDRSTALANSTMLGPLTAFRDVVSSSLGSMGEIAKVSDIPAWTKAWGKVLSGESTALEAGAVRGRNTAEFAIDNSVRRVDGKIADVMRKYQGRDLMEKGIREVLFELGKEMANNRLTSRSTNPSTIAANNKFFETYGGKTWKKLSREELLNTVGTAVMEQMQGSYTPEYLPRVLSVGAGPSLTKATFSLSRWGVERFRRYRQTVIRPIAEEGNILPLAKSTAIYLGLATPAVNAMVQWLTDKKPRNTTWGEYFNLVKDGRPDAHLMDELAYDFVANASLSGMAGILGGLLYQGMQLRHGERAMGYGNPGVSALVDMGKRVADYFQVYSGADLLKNLWRLPTETALQEIQTLRLIRNALDKRPDSGNREEQIYDRVRGKTKFGLGDKAVANPFSPLTKMRKAQTVDDILASGQDLERMYQNVMPERAGRFHNPLRLPPSPEDAMAGENFYRFTTAMQGPGAGEAQLQRDAAQFGLNQVRAGVANIAWNRARARNLLERVQGTR